MRPIKFGNRDKGFTFYRNGYSWAIGINQLKYPMPIGDLVKPEDKSHQVGCLQFNNIESLDAVIQALQDLRGLMFKEIVRIDMTNMLVSQLTSEDDV